MTRWLAFGGFMFWLLAPSGSIFGAHIDPVDIETVLPKDAIQAILEPKFIPAREGDRELQEDEDVIGVAIGREAKAYPIAILSAHEIVNDFVGGEAIAVTW